MGRELDRWAESYTGGQRVRQADKVSDERTEEKVNRQSDEHVHTQMNRQGKNTVRQPDRQEVGRQTSKQVGRQLRLK